MERVSNAYRYRCSCGYPGRDEHLVEQWNGEGWAIVRCPGPTVKGE